MFCVYFKGEGILVNISVSVDARRTVFGINTNEPKSKSTYWQTLKSELVQVI